MNNYTQLAGVFLIFFLCLCFQGYSQDMDLRTMSRIINKESPQVEGEIGTWQAVYGQRVIYIITDVNANRMRIMTPVIELSKVKKKEYLTLLEANFDRALDAKYCIFEDYLMTVYTHPLKELTEPQFIDAMRQVVTLAYNYGTSYTSTDMIFGGEAAEEDKKE